jgi:hypothetical protein
VSPLKPVNPLEQIEQILDDEKPYVPRTTQPAAPQPQQAPRIAESQIRLGPDGWPEEFASYPYAVRASVGIETGVERGIYLVGASDVAAAVAAVGGFARLYAADAGVLLWVVTSRQTGAVLTAWRARNGRKQRWLDRAYPLSQVEGMLGGILSLLRPYVPQDEEEELQPSAQHRRPASPG